MSISSDNFRAVLSHFPSGVTIVTLNDGTERHGLTVSAFASISTEPPLIMVAINSNSPSNEYLQQDGASFGVNILAEEQTELSNRFAWVKDEDRFAEGAWGTAETGAPILQNALAWLDCQVHAYYEIGTHYIYIGRAVASEVPRMDEKPLIYWNRGYRQLDIPAESDES